LREVLSELPFGPGPEYQLAINEHFRHSLIDANALFSNARREALSAVYKNKVPTKTGSAAVAADFEEVAASCGYFSLSLQDFAEDMVNFLDILEELKATVNRYPRRRTWSWLRFWQVGRRRERSVDDSGTFNSIHSTGTTVCVKSMLSTRIFSCYQILAVYRLGLPERKPERQRD
jgi:hypothetical protein